MLTWCELTRCSCGAEELERAQSDADRLRAACAAAEAHAAALQSELDAARRTSEEAKTEVARERDRLAGLQAELDVKSELVPPLSCGVPALIVTHLFFRS
jgi:chromosome segregation ATPase